MKTDDVQNLYKRAAFYEWLFIDFLGWGKELESFFRKSGYIHSGSKILDAGCGTGVITRVLYQLTVERNYTGVKFHAFDLTQAMLEIFRRWVAEQKADNIELQQADVLAVNAFPAHWSEYSLVVSSTMLEYLPKHKVEYALTNLKQLLSTGGVLLVFITKRNLITRWLAEKWWKTNTYEEAEIRTLFHAAGFQKIQFKEFSTGWSSSIMVIEGVKDE
jgi:cyclopropane fatty-acyl-phospholipid synthase-like methyltransferase